MRPYSEVRSGVVLDWMKCHFKLDPFLILVCKTEFPD